MFSFITHVPLVESVFDIVQFVSGRGCRDQELDAGMYKTLNEL